MSENDKDQEALTDASSDFEDAILTNPAEKEKAMSTKNPDYAIDQPFTNHRLYTEYEITNADIDRILRPILEAHAVKLSDYDPYNLSFHIGGKTVQLSVVNYETDKTFEEDMKFIEKEVDLKKTILISNKSSIKGTGILVDFLKAFQNQYPKSFFEEVKDCFTYEEDIQELHINTDFMHDPDLEWVLEIEDPEAYLAEMENGKK